MRLSKFNSFIDDLLAIIIWPTRLLFNKKQIIYDLDYSPSTYGDFTYVIAYAISLSKSNPIQINIKFSNQIYRNHKWSHFSKSEIRERILSIKYYGNFLLKNINVTKEIKISLNEKKNNEINFLNYKIITKIVLLLSNYKRLSSFLGYKKFFFKSNEENPRLINSNYIAIVVRRDIKKIKSSWYDTNMSFLEKLIDCIIMQSNLPIVIVSDQYGCDFAKEILKNKKNIFYSIDFGNIEESILLLLQSTICIQKDGGGICVPYLLSEIPFIASMWPGNLSLFNFLKLKTNNKNQKFLNRIDENIFIKECNLFLRNLS